MVGLNLDRGEPPGTGNADPAALGRRAEERTQGGGQVVGSVRRV